MRAAGDKTAFKRVKLGMRSAFRKFKAHGKNS